MKIWYKAVCDKCGEAANVMVTGPVHTFQYLEDVNAEIQEWLLKHAGCVLRLIHSDEQLDALWEAGFKRRERGEEGHEIGLCVRGYPHNDDDEVRLALYGFVNWLSSEKASSVCCATGEELLSFRPLGLADAESLADEFLERGER